MRQGFTVTNFLSLANLGWQPFFQQQLSIEDWDEFQPARIVEYHKSSLEIATEAGKHTLALSRSMTNLAVGDWVLLDESRNFVRALDRKSCFRRKSAGHQISEQLIAANVDTAFIVCSLNEDFNLNRIERYLSVVNDAGADPVVVLSKMDICSDPDSLRAEVQSLDSLLCVEMVNSLKTESVSGLMHWCKPGKTLVLLGSSGAGKSTLVNSLMNEEIQATSNIRESDSKGKHTTTRRSLLLMPDGAMILDTPGMRELQLADCEAGVSTTFADIELIAERCRFSDCQHDSEPDCAVKKAIEAGELDERRLINYLKLLREQAINGASLAERRSNDRELSRYYKKVQRESKQLKRG